MAISILGPWFWIRLFASYYGCFLYVRGNFSSGVTIRHHILISLDFSMWCHGTMLSWCKWQSQFLSPDSLTFQYVCSRHSNGVSLYAFFVYSQQSQISSPDSLVCNVYLCHSNVVFGILCLYKWQFKLFCPIFLVLNVYLCHCNSVSWYALFV